MESIEKKNSDIEVVERPHRHIFPSFRKKRAATDQNDIECILKVNLLQARNLSRDDETNIPSAYATVRLGGIRQRTDTIKKSSDPEWQCSFEFDLPNDIMPYKKRQRALVRHGLSITVYSKDRFSSIFLGQATWSLDRLPYALQSEATWFPLSLENNKKKTRSQLTTSTKDKSPGEILVQLEFVGDAKSIFEKFYREPYDFGDESDVHEESLLPTATSSTSSIRTSPSASSLNQRTTKLTKDEPIKTTRKEKKRLFRRRRHQSNASAKHYAKFYSDVMGIMFLEIESAKDLPPMKNVTRTGFDMDPFVIVSYGVSTFRTRAIRHNLNPTWNEKLFFHVRSTESNYKLKFAVYDKDKFSNNDFVASQEISIEDIINQHHPAIKTTTDPSSMIEQSMGQYTLPLNLKKPEKWETLHPTLTFKAKFVPYVDIRKMFWIALAKACDADNSNTMSQLEVQTMLETLGSTLSESTLDRFWKDHGKQPEEDLTMDELVKSLEAFLVETDEIGSGQEGGDSLVEEEYDYEEGPSSYDSNFSDLNDDEYISSTTPDDDDEEIEYDFSHMGTGSTPDSLEDDDDLEAFDDAEGVQYVEGTLNALQLENGDEELDSKPGEEKVIRLTECPVCHKPNLYKRGQLDIITHVATCAANDWTTVDRFLMSNYGSEAQAQRKWFVKLVSKVGYGKYSIGKNNANIIVQDRATGQLIDERMSVYIRLGMRLVYKGMKSRIQSKTAKRILTNMTVKQGRRFDDPLSVREIRPFIKFHRLDMSQVLEPIENFKTFNEFFYRKLKPGSRPCDSPDNKNVLVSPADCRMMAFPTISQATSIWIKGVDFSIAKLLDDPEEAKAYEGGSLAIFRLAPQDYHRFHSPVDGVITKIHHVKGQYYTVNPMAIRTTLDVYGDNKRDVVHFQTDAFGKVAVVCVGAMMVGSIILSASVGDYLARTDELGYFAFGGSTLVVLFEKNTIQFDKDLQENAKESLETLVAVGNHIGVHV